MALCQSSVTERKDSFVFTVNGILRDCTSPSVVLLGQHWHLNIAVVNSTPICQLVYDGDIQLCIKVSISIIISEVALPGNSNSKIVNFSRDNNKAVAESSWSSKTVHNVIVDRREKKVESSSTITCYSIINNVKFKVELEEIQSEQTLQTVSFNDSIQTHFSQLLASEEDYDFVFVVGDLAIGAHKLILCARSSVMKAMIKSDMKESTTNKIVIIDFEYDIVKGLVAFIYTEDCGGTLQQEKPELLLMIAHKYAVYGLVQRCVNELSSTLTADNALDRLVLAGTYDLSVLKLNCMKFMRHNKNALIVSDGQEKLRMLPIEVYVELMKYVT